jgi:predicted nuclease with RNAse H fold
MYGIGRDDRASVGWQCLVARRLIERGVRVVEVFDTGANMAKNWDAHVDVQQHRLTARAVDRPIAALIRDLKGKGMAAETLVLVCTESWRGT